MGQSALILSLAATLTILILLVVVGRNTKDSDSELASYHFKVLTREISTTGLNLTVRRLVDEPYRWSDPAWPYEFANEPYRGGTFTTAVTGVGPMVPNFYGDDQDTVDVVSTGRVATAGGGDTTHVIEARYVKGYVNLGLPPAFRKAMFADSSLTLNGKAAVRSADPTVNASIHANDVLEAYGAPVDVEGYGTVSNDPPGDYSNIKPNAEAVFDPNDPQGGSLVYEDNPIYLPPIDASQIDAEYHPGAHMHVGAGAGTDYTMTGDTMRVADYVAASGCSCGTADNPLLYYVDGNLIIGNMIIEGYVQFVVGGDITYNGSVTTYADADADGLPDPEPDKKLDPVAWETWMQGQLTAAGETTIGYYAEGDITANGNFTLTGQQYANGDITLNGGGGGSVDIIGGVVSSEGNITVNGGVTIRFAMIHNTTLLPGLNYIVPEGVRLIAWAEW